MGSDYVIRKVALVSWCRQRLTRPDGQDASLGEISDQTSHNLILLRLKLTVNIDQGSLTSQGLGDHPAPPSVSYLEWVCGYEGHTWPTGRIRHMPATTHPPPSTTRWIYFKVTLSLSRRPLLKREQGFAETSTNRLLCPFRFNWVRVVGENGAHATDWYRHHPSILKRIWSTTSNSSGSFKRRRSYDQCQCPWLIMPWMI